MRARSSATRSGVTSVFAPSMIATASPGISRIIRNTITDTPKSTTRRSVKRESRCFDIAAGIQGPGSGSERRPLP